jgi:serine/threonine-protein kinase TTK/MPS1
MSSSPYHITSPLQLPTSPKNLTTQLQPMSRRLNWIRIYWQQMLEAVDALHNCRIVHRDLKPSNFVLCKARLKLIDFGIAKKMADGSTKVLCEQTVGTLNYMSPESLEDANDGQDVKLSRANDVWSLGCMLYELVYGRPPFAQYRTVLAKLSKIKDEKHVIPIPEVIPSTNEEVEGALRDTLRLCLDRNPVTRAPIITLLNHPFLRGIGNKN